MKIVSTKSTDDATYIPGKRTMSAFLRAYSELALAKAVFRGGTRRGIFPPMFVIINR